MNFFKLKYLALLILFTGSIQAQNITYDIKWVKYFEPVENKIIGVWASGDRTSDIDQTKDLKYRWGFNRIVLIPNLSVNWYPNAIEAGFDTSEVMMQISPVSEISYDKIVDFPRAWAYYIDEPADRDYPESFMIEAKNFIRNYAPNAKIVISGYKRDSDLNHYVANYSDQAMFSSYKHWWTLFGFWVSCCPEDPDQRPDWSDMQNRFGSKFQSSWVGAHRDMSEYPNLLGHANNLGLSGIWFYQVEEPDYDYGNTLQFCEAAAANGFLTTSYQQVRDKYVDGVFESRQFIGPMYFGEPPVSFNHDSLIFEYTIIDNNRIDDYYANFLIRAGDGFDFIIPEDKQASFNTGDTIELKPGFHAKEGSEFRAFIDQ